MTTAYRFIIADDDLPFANMLEAFLTKVYPFAEIIRVFNGGAALALYELGSAHLLLLDITMPLLTGVEVTQILRSRADAVPVVLISAALHTQYDLANDPYTVFFPKPLKLDDLVEAMHQLLEHN